VLKSRVFDMERQRMDSGCTASRAAMVG